MYARSSCQSWTRIIFIMTWVSIFENWNIEAFEHWNICIFVTFFWDFFDHLNVKAFAFIRWVRLILRRCSHTPTRLSNSHHHHHHHYDHHHHHQYYQHKNQDRDGRISYDEFQTMINPPKPPEPPKPTMADLTGLRQQRQVAMIRMILCHYTNLHISSFDDNDQIVRTHRPHCQWQRC